MPKFLEDKLKREYGEKSTIPYKVMNSIGAMRGNKETAEGREMERKHEDKMHNISHIRIEVHREKGEKGKPGKVTGHTVHTRTVPKPSKSPAFIEDSEEAVPFDANGKSSSHGDMLNHIGKHLGLAAASEPEHDTDEEDNDEEEVG